MREARLQVDSALAGGAEASANGGISLQTDSAASEGQSYGKVCEQLPRWLALCKTSSRSRCEQPRLPLVHWSAVCTEPSTLQVLAVLII